MASLLAGGGTHLLLSYRMGINQCPLNRCRRWYVLVLGLSFEFTLSLVHLDTAVIIFDPVIVEPFHGPPDVTPEPPDFQDNFESQESIPKVFQVVDEMNAHPDRASNILQRHLLVGLSDFDKKGTYSRFHEYAIFMHGYNDPRAILMAYMCVGQPAKHPRASTHRAVSGFLLSSTPVNLA